MGYPLIVWMGGIYKLHFSSRPESQDHFHCMLFADEALALLPLPKKNNKVDDLRTNTMAAVLVCSIVSCTPLLAVSEPLAREDFTPSPGVVALASLANAGILVPLVTEQYQGLQQTRIGPSRNTINYTKSLPAGTPRANYKDNDTLYLVPLALTVELPQLQGSNFLRLSFARAKADGDDKVPLENDGFISRASVQVLHVPDANNIYSLAMTYENSRIKNNYHPDGLGSYGITKREALGLQLGYAHDFAGPWAVMGKGEYQKGQTDFLLTQYIAPGVHIPINLRNQGDDRLYLESQLVGTFGDTVPGVPAGWVLHPGVGATFQRDFIATQQDSTGHDISGAVGSTENYGLLFAKLTLEKATRLTPQLQITPRFSLGVEHEYVDDLERYLPERNYIASSLGFGIALYGQRVDFDYSRHDGFEGNRKLQALTTAFSFNF